MLLAHLEEQRDWLVASAARFDSGVASEAKRMALTLRVLLHDTARSRALLSQLGWLDVLQFADSADVEINERTVVAIQLASVGWGSNGFTYVANLGPISERRPFAEWWTRTVVKTPAGSSFSRRALVLALANQDGGGHVDPKLSADYSGLSRDNAIGWELLPPSGQVSDLEGTPVPVQVRKIAYEVALTLDEQLPEMLSV